MNEIELLEKEIEIRKKILEADDRIISLYKGICNDKDEIIKSYKRINLLLGTIIIVYCIILIFL
jgi:hypothetical protein